VEFLRSEAEATTRPTIEALASTSFETVQSMYRAYNGDATEDVMKVVGELFQEVTHADTDA